LIFSGTFVNAMRTSIGREPLILGKPHTTMWEVLAVTHGLEAARSCMVGDRLDTDIAFAANCSLGYSLAVLTGVTNEELILNYASKVKSENNNNSDEAKCLPDYYTSSLGSFVKLIA
jgi:ribonucleotide monophosphatase NagD (HAD superfamily)